MPFLAFTQHFEPKRASDGQRFDEPDLDGIAKLVGTLRAVADKGMLILDVVVIIVAER